ncbi:MAG: hypothetical protein MHM6MM_002113 [Cercozoa sp. M6MM]
MSPRARGVPCLATTVYTDAKDNKAVSWLPPVIIAFVSTLLALGWMLIPAKDKAVFHFVKMPVLCVMSGIFQIQFMRAVRQEHMPLRLQVVFVAMLTASTVVISVPFMLGDSFNRFWQWPLAFCLGIVCSFAALHVVRRKERWTTSARECIVQLMIHAQIGCSVAFAEAWMRVDSVTAQVFFCALYPLIVFVTRSIGMYFSVNKRCADYVGTLGLVWASLPYRLMPAMVKHIEQLAGIWAVEGVYKLIVHVLRIKGDLAVLKKAAKDSIPCLRNSPEAGATEDDAPKTIDDVEASTTNVPQEERDLYLHSAFLCLQTAVDAWFAFATLILFSICSSMQYTMNDVVPGRLPPYAKDDFPKKRIGWLMYSVLLTLGFAVLIWFLVRDRLRGASPLRWPSPRPC